MNYKLVESQKDCDNAIKTIANNLIIGLDTEFVRTKTYFPSLSLIQIATEDKQVFLFDIQSQNINFSALLHILTNEKIRKIIHSAEQDIESILYKFNIKISNIVDTQIISNALEIGHQVGYGTIVDYYFKIKLDKDKQFSAWEKRPLTNQQLEYAARDVVYLIDLYKIMSEELIKKGGELKKIIDLSNCIKYKTTDIDFSIIKKLTRSFCSKFFIPKEFYNIINKIIALREKLAIKFNKTRKIIITDQKIFNAFSGNSLDQNNIGKYIKKSQLEKILKRKDVE